MKQSVRNNKNGIKPITQLLNINAQKYQPTKSHKTLQLAENKRGSS